MLCCNLCSHCAPRRANLTGAQANVARQKQQLGNSVSWGRLSARRMGAEPPRPITNGIGTAQFPGYSLRMFPKTTILASRFRKEFRKTLLPRLLRKSSPQARSLLLLTSAWASYPTWNSLSQPARTLYRYQILRPTLCSSATHLRFA